MPKLKPKKHGRKKWYDEKKELPKLTCVRCGRPAFSQWTSCADNKLWRPICAFCDVKLNNMLMRFFKLPDDERNAKIRKYIVAEGIDKIIARMS